MSGASAHLCGRAGRPRRAPGLRGRAGAALACFTGGTWASDLAVALYRSLRAGAPELAHRAPAERVVEDYLAEIEQRLGPGAAG